MAECWKRVEEWNRMRGVVKAPNGFLSPEKRIIHVSVTIVCYT